MTNNPPPKMPIPPPDRHMKNSDTRPQEYRIMKYHHGFFDKWAYHLERRLIIRFLFWTWEQWEWVAGTGLSDMGHARRWMTIYPVTEVTIAERGYEPNRKWQRPKRLNACRYRVDICTYDSAHSEAFLLKRFLFLWVVIKRSPIAMNGLTLGQVQYWKNRFKIPSEQVESKAFDPWEAY